MKAFVYKKYGSPEVLTPVQIPKPQLKDKDILVKVKAVSLNASDWEFLTGSPAYARIFGLFSPRIHILGTDIAGIVEAVGPKVTMFQVGDAVFGDVLGGPGGFAEYASAHEKKWVRKPDNISFEQASAIPQAGTVALQGLRDKGNIQAGQNILINGAGGGSGSFAIQLAKMFGAEVTGVDSGMKGEFMKSLGADHVIDYRKEDYSQSGKKYDLILDLIAKRSLFDSRRALKPEGKYVIVGGYMKPLLQAAILGPLLSRFSKQHLGVLAHNQNAQDLNYMAELLIKETVRPIIDTCFPFDQVKAALQYLGEGKALGKVVLSWDN